MVPSSNDARAGWGLFGPEECERFHLRLLGCILETAQSAWHQLVSCGCLAATDDENKMSDLLSEKMNALAGALAPEPYHFRAEWRVRMRSHPARKKRDAEPDVVCYYNWRRIQSLVIECKRVSNSVDHRRAALGRDYVDGGVRRFVSGKYARGHRRGMMWGFVLDGDVSGTVVRIADYVMNRKTIPTPCIPWREDMRFGARVDLFTTEHMQNGGPLPIELLHFFLPLPRKHHSGPAYGGRRPV